MIVEFEQQYLGGLFIMAAREEDINDIEARAMLVKPEDFYSEFHGRVHQAVIARLNERKSFDLVTISDAIVKHEKATQGDIGYIAELVRNTASTASLKEYAAKIKNHAVKRQGMALANRLSEAFGESDNPLEVLGHAESLIQELMGKATTDESRMKHIKEVMLEYIDDLEASIKDPDHSKGLRTGKKSVDDFLGWKGFVPGSLVVMGGRPSVGKSAAMLDLMTATAQNNDVDVMAYSMEMPNSQLMERIVSGETKYDQEKLIKSLASDSGVDSQQAWDMVFNLFSRLESSRLYMNDDPNLSIEQIKSDVRQRNRVSKVGAIFIDYLQLMKTAKAENRNLAIGDVTRQLKVLARETGAVIFLLAQLNRDVEKRGDKRPVASDFRDSGSIEQDADYIICLYRDLLYNADTMMGNIGEWLFRKVRHGAIGTVFNEFIAGQWVCCPQEYGMSKHNQQEQAMDDQPPRYSKKYGG